MVLRGRGVEWGGWYLKVSESMGHVKRMVKVEYWILVYIHYLGNKLLRRAIGQLHNQRFFFMQVKRVHIDFEVSNNLFLLRHGAPPF